MFGDMSHVSIDRKHGFVRRFTVTSAAAHDRAQLANVLDATNTASDVWADTAYRSKTSCAVPRCGGISFAEVASYREALWDRFFTAAPRPRTRSEQRYSDRKLRSKSLPHSMD